MVDLSSKTLETLKLASTFVTVSGDAKKKKKKEEEETNTDWNQMQSKIM